MARVENLIESNVELQSSHPDSLLSHMRNLLQLRDKHNALKADIEFEVIFGEKDRYAFIYSRRRNEENILILLNPQNASVNLELINHFSDLVHEYILNRYLNLTPKYFLFILENSYIMKQVQFSMAYFRLKIENEMISKAFERVNYSKSRI